MLKYFLRRFGQMLIVMLVVSILVFFLTSFLGDPVLMLVREDASEAEIQAARVRLGLDRPIYVQYGIFLQDLLQGNFGVSYTYGKPAMSLILERFPATMEVVIVASLLIIFIAIPLGVYAGAFPNRRSSKLIMGGSILGISLPNFWIGMMLIYIFAVELHVMPASGRGQVGTFLGISSSLFTKDGWKHLILPSVTLAISNIASTLRLTRSGIIETMREDFVKFLRAKGAGNRRIMFGHALKNALIPVVTVLGLNIGGLIAFTTVTETIYAWPGMGKLLIDSIGKADRPIIVAYLMVTAGMFVVINFIVDILYSLIDPRISLA
ncbi:MAG: ABC transporter permease [Eubacteriales bacterium]|nr:ABC transporter permease [Clostridiales bacterium]MDY5835858.1 ABC transporter permease [Eubacteriales bacterium]